MKSKFDKNILILAVILVIVIAGVLFILDHKIVKQPTKQDCPYECCIGNGYQAKSCQGDYECIANKCVGPVCPYECCLGIDYQPKSCSPHHECVNNECVPEDSDNDGLTDIEENKIGTNPGLADTDGDNLSDYQEVKTLHTDPLNTNTDGDRYDDDADPDPLVVNTADITAAKSNEIGAYNQLSLIKVREKITEVSIILKSCTAGTTGACADTSSILGTNLGPILNDVIYTSEVDVTFTNQGDDYTSYIDYDVVYYVGTERLDTYNESTERLDANRSITIPHHHEIRVKDIPPTLWDSITRVGKITVEIENLEYESWSTISPP